MSGARIIDGLQEAADLEARIKRLAKWWDEASEAEKEAMTRAQRESWVRAMAPCEHGDPDWETCPQCRNPS